MIMQEMIYNNKQDGKNIREHWSRASALEVKGHLTSLNEVLINLA